MSSFIIPLANRFLWEANSYRFWNAFEWAQPSKERKVFCIPLNSPWAARYSEFIGLEHVRVWCSAVHFQELSGEVCALHSPVACDRRPNRTSKSVVFGLSSPRPKTNKIDKCACDRNCKRDQRTHSQSATISDTVTGLFELTVGECELLVSIRCFFRFEIAQSNSNESPHLDSYRKPFARRNAPYARFGWCKLCKNVARTACM